MAQRSQAHVALGAALRGFRQTRGYSQERLAELVDLHRTYVSDIERGNRNPSYTNIRKLADALKVRTSELFERAEELEGQPPRRSGTDSSQN